MNTTRITATMSVALLLACGAMAPRVEAAIDHTHSIERHIEDLRCQADDLRAAFRNQFRRSYSYNELMRHANEIKGAAWQFRSLVRSRHTTSCQLGDALDELDCLVDDMQALVDIARLRADRRLDPPLLGCTLHVDQLIAQMRGAIFCMRRDLGIFNAPRQGHFGGGYRTGMGYSTGRVPFHGTQSSFDFDRGFNGFERTHPSGGMHSGQPAFATPRPGSQGVELLGRGGRGVELSPDGGIVLKLGGAAFQIR